VARAVATTNSTSGIIPSLRVTRAEADILQWHLFRPTSVLPSSTSQSNNDTAALQETDDADYTDDQYIRDLEYAGMEHAFVAIEQPQQVRRINAITTSVRRRASPPPTERPESPPIRYFANMAIVVNTNSDDIDSSTDDRQQQSMPDRISSSNVTVRHQNHGSNIRGSIRESNVNPQIVSSSTVPLVSNGNVKREEVKEEDPRTIANRNRYFAKRRRKLKKQKQREYDLSTPEQQQEMDRQQILRRNCYYYFRRQALKKEKEQLQQPHNILST
jgi:hypothetical protein